MARVDVRKTYKLYIGGAFPRSESGHSYEVTDSKGRFVANAALASRKDVRDAVVAAGTVVVKAALMVSYEEQGERLAERLERRDKHWKYNPSDIDTRLRWDDYQEAYQAVFDRTSTEHAPWHVIPADKKWYRNLAIGTLLLDALRSFDLDWPAADFDVEHERRRLQDEPPL